MITVEEHIRWLGIPVYGLYYVTGGERPVDAAEDLMRKWKTTQTNPQYRKSMLAALEWAAQNPGFEYSKILPDLDFSNDEVFQYLLRVRELMLQQEVPHT